MVNAVKLALEGAPPVRTKDRFLVFGRPALGEEEISALAEAIRSGWPGTGPRTQELEDAFARYVGANHAVAVSSCTAALHLAMIVSGVRPGDEVITTPLTFVATANAIEHTGASPVFVDIDRGKIRLGIEAPRDVPIYRQELLPLKGQTPDASSHPPVASH